MNPMSVHAGAGRMWVRCGLTCLLLVFSLVPSAASAGVSRTNDTHLGGRICGSIDIRNSVRHFELLRGCRVVEGFVLIDLIEGANETDFESISFPELLEITCYLLLYRVEGLRSEVGLWSLTAILRGSVRIEKNPGLCYVDTIDWDAIATGEHFIVENKDPRSCPGSTACAKDGCEKSRCWNSNKRCQKLSSHKNCHELCLGGCTGPGSQHCIVCRRVLNDGVCSQNCPPDRYEYLGRRCITETECRRLDHMEASFRRWEPTKDSFNDYWWPFNGSCVHHCPPGFEKRWTNKLLSCEPCSSHCRRECLGGVVNSIASAQILRGCTYITNSLEIQIRGGIHVVKELENNLNMIEEINGYLKVSRSFPLISLSFLSRLRVINGRDLDQNKYALVVMDNENLKELWDWDSRPRDFHINNGSLFFHFNPKLCLSEIDKLKEIARLGNYTNLEVARESNGDKVACNLVTLDPHVTVMHSTLALIEWESYVAQDPHSLLGYIVHYIEAPRQNVTMYDGREACVNNGWRVIDVTAPEESDDSLPSECQSECHLDNGTRIDGHCHTKCPRQTVSQPLTHLQPYTQYAFYLKTFSVTNTGGQSKIQYFRTFPDRPSIPLKLKGISNSSSEINLRWLPPIHSNGILSHYVVSGLWQKDDTHFLDQRDYCAYPLLPSEEAPIEFPPSNTMTDNDPSSCCINESQQLEIEDQDDYESFCTSPSSTPHSDNGYNSAFRWGSNSHKEACASYLYTYLQNKIRTQREEYSSEGKLFPNSVKHASSSLQQSGMPVNQTVIVDGVYKGFSHRIEADTTYTTLKNLHHFAEYIVEVVACREPHPSDHQSGLCSFASMITLRTRRLEAADVITSGHINVEMHNETAGEVYLTWKEPRNPNGVIISYHVEYRRVDIENFKPILECITRKQHESGGGGYMLNKLPPGNYSFRVRATSLAGDGPFTKTIYFNINEKSKGAILEIMLGICVGSIFVITIALFIIFWKRRTQLIKENMLLFASVNPDYISSGYVEDKWEVPRDELELRKELGQGSFGMVYEGMLRQNTRCAVKIANGDSSRSERMEFLNEASVMKSFSEEHHVVKLLGVVSRGLPPLVIMELMEHGDLKSYLRSTRTPPPPMPDMARVLLMAAEIADGMAYLEASKFVHRDLAARNCMVAVDYTIKIGDFGMTRDIYETDYYRNGNKGFLPVRWMAPESLGDGLYSSMSDVWSYGVVLWEIATLAEQPYQGLTNEQVLQFVLEGGILTPPQLCPPVLRNLMESCCQRRSFQRPCFYEIVEKLESIADLGPTFKAVSFYHKHLHKGEHMNVSADQRQSEPQTSPDSPEVSFSPSRNGNEVTVHWTQYKQNDNKGSESAQSQVEPSSQELALELSCSSSKSDNQVIPQPTTDSNYKFKLNNGVKNGCVYRS